MARNKYKVSNSLRVPFEVKNSVPRQTFSLPGIALAHHRYDGFGKELFVPVDETLVESEEFKEEFDVEDSDGTDGASDD